MAGLLELTLLYFECLMYSPRPFYVFFDLEFLIEQLFNLFLEPQKSMRSKSLVSWDNSFTVQIYSMYL